MFTSEVPFYLSILFLFAIGVPILMVANLLRNTTYKHKRKQILLFYMVYFMAVAIACWSGLFDVVSFPPRIVLFTTLPLLLFYLGYFLNTSFYKKILNEITLTSLISVHVFRFIGVFFLLLFFYNQLPKPFALVAGIGDIITAFTSIFVVTALRKKKNYSKTLLLVWNTFGLLDILITSAGALYFTKQSIETGSLGVEILAQFPFCFIPAFAPATIIFLHISIYRKVFLLKKG